MVYGMDSTTSQHLFNIVPFGDTLQISEGRPTGVLHHIEEKPGESGKKAKNEVKVSKVSSPNP